MADEPKTRALVGVLEALGAGDGHARRVLVVAPGQGRAAAAVGREPAVGHVILADSLNVVDLLNADAVLIEQPALARIEEVYA